MKESNALADHDWLIAAAGNPYVHELAAAVPEREGGPGRRKDHPAVVGLLYILAAGGITGSHRSAVLLMESQPVWRAVRLAVRDTARLSLPRRSPSRAQLELWRKHLAAQVGTLCDRARDSAVKQAIAAGCFRGTGSIADLLRSNTLVGDGKVVTAPILSKTADRWREEGRLIDTGLHKQAGDTSGVYVIGSKFVIMGVRLSEARNARILLDMAYLPPGKGYGGEAGVAVAMIQQLQSIIGEHGGRADSACYDGAFRSAHIDPLIKSGLVVLSPVHPTAAARTPLELVRDCPCGILHRLETMDGRICETQVMDTGEQHTVPLTVKRLVKRRDQSIPKAYRWYQEVELSCGAARLVRVDGTEEDQRTGFKRAERIRQNAPPPPPEAPPPEAPSTRATTASGPRPRAGTTPSTAPSTADA